jgi:hypothetical protein
MRRLRFGTLFCRFRLLIAELLMAPGQACAAIRRLLRAQRFNSI